MDLPAPPGPEQDARVDIEQLDFGPLSAVSAEPSRPGLGRSSQSQAPAIADLEVSISDSGDGVSFDLGEFVWLSRRRTSRPRRSICLPRCPRWRSWRSRRRATPTGR